MTRMDRQTADEHAEKIRKEYDRFVEYKKRRTAEALAEAEAAIQGEVAAELAKVSRSVREAYSVGVPKMLLREATRAYTNTEAWNRIWNAAADEVPVVDRGSGQVKEVTPFTMVFEDPADAKAKYVEAGKKASLVVRSGPDLVEWDEDVVVVIPLEKKSLTGPWVPEPGFEWYSTDPETGDQSVKDDYTQLFQWGDTDAEVIDKIEQQYRPRKSK